MSLRTVFLLCFAVACLPALGWSAWTAVRAQAGWTQADQAVRAAQAMGDAQQLIAALSMERSAVQERILRDGPGAYDLTRLTAKDDALLARSRASLQRAGLSDAAVQRAQEVLATIRTGAAAADGSPLAERNPRLAEDILAHLNDRLDAVVAAVATAEQGASRANAAVGALIGAGSLAVEIRFIAGRRGSIITGWLAGGTLTPSQLDDAMLMTGKIQHAWTELQRQVLILGEPPRLVAAITTLREGFFRNAEPRYRELIATARAGGERPTSMPAFRLWTIRQLLGIDAMRIAAITEAVAFGQAQVVAAQEQLAIAAAATLGLLALAAGAVLVLLRRLVLPVQRLTAAVTRLAGGDVATEVPERDRHDDVGTMAAAIEIFRQNAVELQQTNLRFDAALSNMSQGLAMYDADERLVVINARLLGDLPPGQLRVGMSFHEVIAARSAAGQFPGRTVDEVYADRRHARISGVVGRFEEVQSDVIYEVSSRPTADGGWITTYLDATERLRAEAALREANELLEQRVADALARHRDIEEALRQSQKMEAVGQLTGGLAHDFNNMLASISGSLEILQVRIGQGRVGKLDRYIAMATAAAKGATALTHRLLAFSRRQTLDPRPTDVNRLIAEMEDLLSRTVGPATRLEVVGAGELWSTLIDPNQLENALLNLCINARDAMPDGGRLTIETANRRFETAAIRDEDLPPGEYVALCVSDTGTGMSPDVVSRAFDPFFTTKPIGLGTGLGLSMIYGFVRQSGGRVSIRSEVGRGTQVSLYLPRHGGVPDREEKLPEPIANARSTHHETILVVDDEPTLRMLVAEVLEDRGYAAIACSDGPAGLKVLESDRRIDLLITDVGLPGGMNGRQLADAARRTRADLKVLFITGYAASAAVASGQLDPGMQVMTKPFPLDALASRVRSIIANG